MSLSISERTMLCVVFMRFSDEWAIEYLKSNIGYAGDYCTSWALMPYLPVTPAMTTMIESFNQSLLDHAALHHTKVMYLLDNSQIDPQKQGVLHKGCLYTHLLPYLPSYNRVWLLDEDFTLEGFNFMEYFGYWDYPGGLLQHTMITQGLVRGRIDHVFLSYTFPLWASQRTNSSTHLVAFPTNFIEVQAPILDAAYFKWFLINIQIPAITTLATTKLDRCHDHGFPYTWCHAAKEYLIEKGHNSDHNMTCMVIAGSSYTTHNDRKTMGKGKDRLAFNKEGDRVRLLYQALYPDIYALKREYVKDRRKWIYPKDFISSSV